MVIHEKFPEFVLFLYLHLAHADGSMHPHEESIVREKMLKLFPEGTDLNETFDKALKAYQETKKEEIPGLIKDTFDHFRQVPFSAKYRVYTDMYDIINADGRVDDAETSALDQLRKIIDIGSVQKSTS